MITTVQAVEARLSYIENVTQHLRPIIHVDKKMNGCLPAFIDMLDYDVDDYRLHLQDDVILTDDLHKYLPVLVSTLHANDIDLLGLYVPQGANLRASHKLFDCHEYSYAELHMANYFPIQGVLFSKKMNDILREEVAGDKREVWEKITIGKNRRKLNDDEFLTLIMRKYNIKSYVHVPSLVQHNTEDFPSLIGSTPYIGRTTVLFDKQYLSKNKQWLNYGIRSVER